MNVIRKATTAILFTIACGLTVPYANLAAEPEEPRDGVSGDKKPDSGTKQLQRARVNVDRLIERLKEKDEPLAAEFSKTIQVYRDTTAKLCGKEATQALADRRNCLEGQFPNVVGYRRVAESAWNASRKISVALDAELAALRKQVVRTDTHPIKSDCQRQRRDKIGAIVAKSGEMLDTLAELERIRKQDESAHLGRGVVVATTAGGAEVSLGAAHGIREGDELQVYRKVKPQIDPFDPPPPPPPALLGRIVIRRVTPKRAVGQALPGFLNGPIRKGDLVRSKVPDESAKESKKSPNKKSLDPEMRYWQEGWQLATLAYRLKRLQPIIFRDKGSQKRDLRAALTDAIESEIDAALAWKRGTLEDEEIELEELARAYHKVSHLRVENEKKLGAMRNELAIKISELARLRGKVPNLEKERLERYAQLEKAADVLLVLLSDLKMLPDREITDQIEGEVVATLGTSLVEIAVDSSDGLYESVPTHLFRKRGQQVVQIGTLDIRRVRPKWVFGYLEDRSDDKDRLARGDHVVLKPVIGTGGEN